ncbi:hypothetical protein [Clostridium sp. CF012]|uniref:hypothetical protein n=1 Tax=Clostridium sp. CF012 TaxID=2843319 RepID=UPI001C0AF9D5|nr:hypothetical protein [Clostridium sp. CF012]MBU3142234.1 hypothetical protein [Clostridium sp. CF012]
MKDLSHYTSTFHLLKILKSGYLNVSQGILDDAAVWLTTSKVPVQAWQEGSCVDKSEIRFILKDIKALKWCDYKKKYTKGSNKSEKQQWAKALEVDNVFKSWWLSEDIIPLEMVEAIENTKTGKKVILVDNYDNVLKILL